MDILEVIKSRRSIRTFQNREVMHETVNQLLDAARWAPSAGNVQPWAFVVVSTQNLKHNLSLAAYGQKDIEEAPIVIVVCADEKQAEERYGQKGKALYCLQDTAAATQNILLTAYSLGLGTCWIGAFKEEETKKVINAPKNMRPVAMIPVGYPNETPQTRERRPLTDIVYKDGF